MRGLAWTPEEDAILAAEIAAGKTYSEISAIIGVGRGAIAGRAWRLGMKGPRSKQAAA